jgi:mannosyltransferase OCH1-like enzyme
MMDINKTFEYKLFDDTDMDNFIKNNYNKEIYNCFNSLNIGAAKADFWRYLILYKTGGVYLDIDSIIYGNLNELLDDECAIITRENNCHFLRVDKDDFNRILKDEYGLY